MKPLKKTKQHPTRRKINLTAEAAYKQEIIHLVSLFDKTLTVLSPHLATTCELLHFKGKSYKSLSS